MSGYEISNCEDQRLASYLPNRTSISEAVFDDINKISLRKHIRQYNKVLQSLISPREESHSCLHSISSSNNFCTSKLIVVGHGLQQATHLVESRQR